MTILILDTNYKKQCSFFIGCISQLKQSQALGHVMIITPTIFFDRY